MKNLAFTDKLRGTATATLLDELETFVRRFIVLSNDAQAAAIVLWLMHTHAIDAAEATPYLYVVSPEKRSGKTRLLELLTALARNGVHVANISEAALFRMLDGAGGITALIDEVDALFESNAERTEGLRGIINAGNRRSGHVVRCVPPSHNVNHFKVFSAKALGGIDTGRLPDTVRDRSITLRLQRKTAAERVDRLLWRRVQPEADALRDRLAEWAVEHLAALEAAEPELPRELDDRAAEAWWSLFAIADLAGRDWHARARTSAVELHAGGAEDDSRGVQLLTDLRGIFNGQPAMHTSAILEVLNGLDESPWGGWHAGSGVNSRDLARLLKPYGVKPRSVRTEDRSAKGYHRDALEPAWERYTADGSQASQGSQPALQADSDVTFASDVTSHSPNGSHENPRSGAQCDPCDLSDLSPANANGQADLLADLAEELPQPDDGLCEALPAPRCECRWPVLGDMPGWCEGCERRTR